MTDPIANRERTRCLVAFVPRRQATIETYRELGFRCGLEIHQQLKTKRKLFCRCPAGQYQAEDDYDAQLVRHMRPTLSELGEYDGTALMEFKTKKNIVYRIKGETACTYDIDDTPPFALNREALGIALKIALLLDTSIVGELHIARKQYLDGSIPTGFQRTGIIGIEGEILVGSKRVGIRQLSIEEDSCREVSDRGHERIYTTDRLGMPLVEAVTEPELFTPDEAAAAANVLRYLARSTGLVNTGIGAAREDVNVSITGGTRVEIKGVQHIRWIPDLTHNEAFRQRALLLIRDQLREQFADGAEWALTTKAVDRDAVRLFAETQQLPADAQIVAARLPGFAGLLSFFTSPGRCFADELSDRVKVVACIDRPNMTHSESIAPLLATAEWEQLGQQLAATSIDALILVWGPASDVATAVETIDERCRWVFDGVPNETRKGLPDGTTVFERVLPGPDRMYPDTDSAPIPIHEDMIAYARQELPALSVAEMMSRLVAWEIPLDAHGFILRWNLFELLRALIEDHGLMPRLAGSLVGHALRQAARARPIDTDRVRDVVKEAIHKGLVPDSLKLIVRTALDEPNVDLEQLLERIGYAPHLREDILAAVGTLVRNLPKNGLPLNDARNWIMGQIRPMALGNLPLAEVAKAVAEVLR